MKCSLCGSGKVIKLETRNPNSITKFYNINIDRFFSSETFSLYRCMNCDLKMFDGVIPGDSDFYDYMQTTPMYYEEEKEEFNFAISMIQKYNPKTLLEIGAGQGFFLEKLLGALEVRVNEFSEKSKQILKKKNIQFDEEGMTYDFICSFQVFEHVKNLKALIEFCDKKLNNKGYILISVPNEDSIYNKEVFNWMNYPPHHIYRFSKVSLENIARLKNYRVMEYWKEPLRIEHFITIIRDRREKTLTKYPIGKKIFSLFDHFIAPYFLDSNTMIGHTHAILLQKENELI